MSKNGVINILVSQFTFQLTTPILQIIAQTAAEKGVPCSGSRFTGGTQGLNPSRQYLRLGQKVQGSPLPPEIPPGEGDILLGFEAGIAARLAAEQMSSHGTAIINTWQYHPPNVPPPHTKYPAVENILELLGGLLDRVIPVDAVGLAKKAGDPKVAQGVLEHVMLGALMGTKLLPFSADDAEAVLIQLCRPEQQEMALQAYRLGVQATATAT